MTKTRCEAGVCGVLFSLWLDVLTNGGCVSNVAVFLFLSESAHN